MPFVRKILKRLGLRLADVAARLFLFRHKDFRTPEAIYILMLRPLGLGDLMMLSPFILEMAERFQDVPTFLVTEYPAFMDIHGVVWMSPKELDIPRRRNGLVVSPTLSWRHLPYLRGAGWFIGYFLSNRMISNFARYDGCYEARNLHYYNRADRILAAMAKWRAGGANRHYPGLITTPFSELTIPGEYVCIAPAANWAERQYPLDQYREIIFQLCRRYPVVLVGGQTPMEIEISRSLQQAGVVNTVGMTNITQAAEIISRARLFIGNDSGLSHMAFLSGTRSIVIFGCVPGTFRVPLERNLSDAVTALGAGDACPYFPCYDGYNRPKCINPEAYVCLSGIKAQQVVDLSRSLLDETCPGGDSNSNGMDK